MSNIRLELQNAVLRSTPHIETGYNTAIECDPGCSDPCEDQIVIYENVTNEINEIEILIAEYETKIKIEKQKQANILESCPHFADLTDEEIDALVQEQKESYTTTTTTTTTTTSTTSSSNSTNFTNSTK